MEKAKVYFTKEITPESLIKIYESLGVDLKGNVAVKISTGEPGGHNFLNPNLIKDLIQKVDGTIVECSTAYGGNRQDPKKHWEAIKNHGFFDIAPCDIMDEFEEIEIPIPNGFHLDKDIVGGSIDNYDSFIILSHFKGHAMGGFGGALKNMSIGIASTSGKAYIHTAGKTKDASELWNNLPEQDDFLESMADACAGVIAYKGKENIIYINVANNLSIDCDCDSNPHEPEMKDIGVFASIDPVALDQACYDAIIHSDDPKKESLIQRIEEKHGIHTVEAACELGLGSREYEIISID